MHTSGHFDPRGSEGAHEKARRSRRGRYGPPGPTVFYYPVQRGDARHLPQRTSQNAVNAKFAASPFHALRLMGRMTEGCLRAKEGA
jgi:hypothetical protein